MKPIRIDLFHSLLGVALLATITQAQNFEQKKTLIASGGSASADGYELSGSMGQINSERATGGPYTLQAGFWQQNIDLIFEAEFE